MTDNPEHFFMTEMHAMALGLHEVYTSLMAAGFTEEQAFRMVLKTLEIAAGGPKE